MNAKLKCIFWFYSLSIYKCMRMSLSHPRREAGDVWCLPPVWNVRAVIWFHFAISSLVLLPSPVTLSVWSFSACWPFLLNFFQKILQYFSLRDRLFLYGSCFAVRRSELVGVICSMLPYGTGISCYALISYFVYFFVASVYSFSSFSLCTFKKSGINKLTKWSTIPACHSLMCFFKRGNTEGTNSSKILYLMFVYVSFYVNLCGDWFVFLFCFVFWEFVVWLLACVANRKHFEVVLALM